MDEIDYPEQEIAPDAEETFKNEVESGIPPPEEVPEATTEIGRDLGAKGVEPIRGMQVQGANMPQFQMPQFQMPPFPSFGTFNQPNQKNPLTQDPRVSFLIF